MSLRLEMLQAARLAPKMLGEAAAKVETFLAEQWCEDGGGADRAGKSDLYYTAFALDAQVAMRVEPPVERVRAYLERFGCGEELDFVHQACLVRCWSAIGGVQGGPPLAEELLPRLEARRCSDGGYASEVGADHGTLYHAFLALGMYQDLGRALPEAGALVESFEGLRSQDGGYANARDLLWGTTPSTAAACEVMRQLGFAPPADLGAWMLSQIHEKGGFRAMPGAPIPDLLSTATALHALAGMGLSIGVANEVTLDFLDSLWSGRAFYGHWSDESLDCEYAFYALLALGHLSLGGGE